MIYKVKDLYNRFYLASIPGLFLSLCLFPFCPLQADPQSLISQIQGLDKAYQALSAQFYQQTSGDLENNSYTDESLFEEVDRLLDEQQEIQAIQLLYANKTLLLDNIDHPQIFQITDSLLEQNEWQLASQLFDQVVQENDKSLLASMRYVFAKFYASRKKWDEVERLLKDSIAELSPQYAALAYVLSGSALQHLKKHRQAAELYSRIPSDSDLYLNAQLNLALTSIRQGWISDAQTRLKGLISQKQAFTQDELFQRLYLILGYALLQQEYYRDARNTFREISLSSQYANKALLGIGLTATSQGDYIGGLNALEILKTKTTPDLSVDEAYLIIPYVYEKLQQHHVLGDQYSLAIDYYENRLLELRSLLNKNYDFAEVKLEKNTGQMMVDNNLLDYSQYYPDSFFDNYRRLQRLSEYSHSTHLAGAIHDLSSRYHDTLQRLVSDRVEQHLSYIKSYLSQSRFGLARFYDKNQESGS